MKRISHATTASTKLLPMTCKRCKGTGYVHDIGFRQEACPVCDKLGKVMGRKTQPRKTPAQLQREIDGFLAKRPQYDNADTFWNAFEDQVTKDVATWGPSRTGRYGIGDGKQRVRETDEPPEVFARRVRDASREIADAKGIRALTWNSKAFQKLGRQLGLKVHTLAGLSALYDRIRTR